MMLHAKTRPGGKRRPYGECGRRKMKKAASASAAQAATNQSPCKV